MRTERRLLGVSLITLLGCASQPPPAEQYPAMPEQQVQGEAANAPASADSAEQAAPAGTDLASQLPNGRAPSEGVYTAGQPSEAQLAAAKAAGVTRVVNLRPEAEQPFDEKAAVEGLGMTYVAIPVAGAKDLTPEAAQRLDAALQGEGATLVHCGSSNRVGALFALRAGTLQGMDVDAALTLGRDHGMTGLEPAVRELLDGTTAKP